MKTKDAEASKPTGRSDNSSGHGGPRTALGKRGAKYNALKHGIFSAVIVLKGESRAEYDALLNGMRDSWQPQGMLEEALVEKLATLLWRQKRFLQAEGAEIARAREFSEIDSVHCQVSEAAERERLGGSAGGLLSRRSNPFALARAIHLLEILRLAVERGDLDWRPGFELFPRIYGIGPQGEIPNPHLACEILAAMAGAHKQKGTVPGSLAELKKSALTIIDDEIEHLTREMNLLSAVDKYRIAYNVQAAVVPSQETLDRLLRYEVHLSREFDRTLNQLERLQRMRLGQPVPPRVKVEVSA